MIKTEEICNVLVVDDEPGMAKGVERTLRNFQVNVGEHQTLVSFNVKSVLSAEDFYKITENEKFDLILLDYKLPNITGLELLEYINDKMCDSLVIMITAYATLETAVQSTKLGAYDFLAKPFNPEELRISVKKATKHLILTKQARVFEEEKRKIRFHFISLLSHELKAPLNAVEGYIDILTGRYNKLSEDEYNNMLSRCKLRINGMRKLIFDLLDMTRIESGEKKRIFENIDLVQLTCSSIELLKAGAIEKNVQVSLLNKEPVLFNSDKAEMEIVINNLISNAIKYNNNNGKVIIKIKKNAPFVFITVADTGIGIEKTDINNLFKEFSRIKNSKTLNILGSGLGLSTIKKLCILYNGNVRVKSKYEKGTVFWLKLKEY